MSPRRTASQDFSSGVAADWLKPAQRFHRAPPRRLAVIAGAAVLALAGAAQAQGLPTGASVVAGQAAISQQGQVLTVQQASNRLITEWRRFDIGAGQTVNFVQPSGSAVALNRVLGPDASVIQGALRANGQVFLVNPNGVLFSPTAQVDVGGLVASTLALGNDDFLAGRLAFNGHSTAAVVNQGRITAQGADGQGGVVALLGARISNTGSLNAPAGSVLLGAGSRVTLDLGGPVKLQVSNDLLDTLIDNGGAIRADGGQVWLSSQAAGALASSVINHSGVIDANALDASHPGSIVLHAAGGQAQVSGTLQARGGLVETSGRTLAVSDAATIRAGHWLVDPTDITIEASGGTNLAGSSIAAGKIQDVLNGANGETAGAVTLVADNDISVNQALSWSSNQLTLAAGRNVQISAPVTASGSGSLSLKVGMASADGAGGTWSVAGAGSLVVPSATAFTWQKGSAGALNNLIFSNGLVRFGNGTEAAFTAEGLLKQPWTFDNATAGRNGWYKLTYSSRALEFALAAGGDGTNPWNYSGQVLLSGSSYGTALSNRSIDLSRYHEGYGTVVTRGRVTFASGQIADVSQTYQLDASARFVNLATDLTNRDSATLANVRMWIGTGDDFVGNSDVNTKTKGNIAEGVFTALTDASAPANAIKVTEGAGSSGAAVLFYSTTPGADTVHASCCSFTNVTNKSPRSSALTAMTDGSYAIYMRLADLAPGASGGMGVYYAAAPVSELAAAVTSVNQAATQPAAATPVYLRLTPGSSVYGDTPSFAYGLYTASIGGNLVTDAALSGAVSWLGAPTAISGAGSYSISYGSGLTLGGTSYTLNAGAASLWTVTPRPLNLSVSKVYDGSAAFGAGFQLSGLVNGDAMPTVRGSASVASRDVGGHTGFAASTLVLSDPNYTLAGGTVAATVTPRPITLTADAQTKVYGSADPALSYQLSSGSLVDGDTLAGAVTRAAGSNVGSYAIDLSALANPNYTVTTVNGTLTITPRPITVTADDKIKVYGNPDPALSYRISSGSLVDGDTLAGALTRAAGEDVSAHAISAAALANDNYRITVVDGRLNIVPAVKATVLGGLGPVLIAPSPAPVALPTVPGGLLMGAIGAPVMPGTPASQVHAGASAASAQLLVFNGGIRLPAGSEGARAQ